MNFRCTCEENNNCKHTNNNYLTNKQLYNATLWLWIEIGWIDRYFIEDRADNMQKDNCKPHHHAGVCVSLYLRIESSRHCPCCVLFPLLLVYNFHSTHPNNLGVSRHDRWTKRENRGKAITIQH